MVYAFARVNAALTTDVLEYFVQGRRGWPGCTTTGGKEHEVPCHHNLERSLDVYISTASPLFRTAVGKTGLLTAKPLLLLAARRPPHDPAARPRGRHHGLSQERSPRNTNLYDRRIDEISLDEGEHILI